MPHLLIQPSHKLRPANPGNFNVAVEPGYLFAPVHLAHWLASVDVRSAEEFVSFVHSFPTSVATALGWTNHDVERARDMLVGQLRGIVRNDVLYPPQPPKRFEGTRPPPQT